MISLNLHFYSQFNQVLSIIGNSSGYTVSRVPLVADPVLDVSGTFTNWSQFR